MGGEVHSLQGICTKNRAEELGFDVWKHFVVPLFFDELDLSDASKPRLIIGGRGCGKTMLLRYLSHHSIFSPNRSEIPSADLRHLGLYWKIDTHFLKLMLERGLDNHVWESAFVHYLAIVVSTDILRCLRNIAGSALRDLSIEQLNAASFPTLMDFADDLAIPENGSHFDALTYSLERKERLFQTWVNDPRKAPEPRFLPGKEFVAAVIKDVQRAVPAIRDSVFFVYIDEYENLREYQQRIINTFLKHSEPPLIFNIAMKRNGMKTPETVGEESIAAIADYRPHPLDDYLERYDFELFAAEVLFSRFATMAQVQSLPVDVDDLRRPESLKKRHAREYVTKVTSAAKQIFPGLSRLELAQGVFSDESLRRQLRRAVESALKARGADASADAFVREDLPEASVITPALLHRKSHNAEEIKDELRKLSSGEANSFTGPADWIHNNFVGSLLQLYAPYGRACPFYAGFDTFIALARGNLRHYLELCHKSLKRASVAERIGDLRIEPGEQAESARQASTEFLREVRTFGRLGNRLHAFVLTLGSVFEFSRRRPTQSEPEVSHFSVRGGPGVLDDKDEDFFSEAVKWSVLIEFSETKIKDQFRPEGKEWQLNPIYSPYFHITYRKRRKIEFDLEELHTMIRGDVASLQTLLKGFIEKWTLTPQDAERNLFSHLEEDRDDAGPDAAR